ncbi:MAG: hypothetical protein IPM79_29610 [Polyangiaceae bacterium]|jgi:hypothetical protein|nr:hypothetical protein [Polyangiaceae bacterium]MBK8941649.1 hypothetical protein [Polyangiaceae bacterium]
MTEAPAPSASASPPSSITLRAVRPLAAGAVAVALLAGALIPAMHGWIVGVSRLVDAAGVFADGVTQALAIFLVFGLGALVVEALRSRVGLALKGLVLLLGSLVAMAVLTTMAVERVPLLMHAILVAASSALALACGASALSNRALAGLAPLLVGVASLGRGLGAYVAEEALRDRRDLDQMSSAMGLARWLATSSSVLVLGAVAVTGYFLVRSEGRRGAIGLAAAGVVSLLVGWRASAPVDPDEAAWSVLIRRTGQELLSLPTPHLPAFVTAVLAALALAVACVAVGLSARQPVVGASLALALIAGQNAEVPVLALSLTVGAIALAVDRRDGQGVQAALALAERAAARVEAPPPANARPEDQVVAARSLD